MLHKTDYCSDPVEVLYYVTYKTDDKTFTKEHYDKRLIEETFECITTLMNNIATDDFPIDEVSWGAVTYINGELDKNQYDEAFLSTYTYL